MKQLNPITISILDAVKNLHEKASYADIKEYCKKHSNVIPTDSQILHAKHNHRDKLIRKLALENLKEEKNLPKMYTVTLTGVMSWNDINNLCKNYEAFIENITITEKA